MNRKIQILILFLLIAFINNPVDAFAGMGGGQNSTQIDILTNTTESDVDVVLLQHLIIVDSVEFQSENMLLIKETVVFKNLGLNNFSGSLSTWVPDNALNLYVAKTEMSQDIPPLQLPHILKKMQIGNITIWSATIQANKSLMYDIVYQIPLKEYSKVLLYPTETKQPISFIVRIIKNNDEIEYITDMYGNNIISSAITTEELKSSYSWESPQFTEIKVVLTKPAVVAPSKIDNLGIYLIIGILLILVFSYPVLRTKSEKLREFEERIKGLFKKEESVEEKNEEDTEPKKQNSEKKAAIVNNAENAGLETEKDELLSKLGDLDKKYASGDLMDEEYDELRKPYQQRLKQIKKLIGS